MQLEVHANAIATVCFLPTSLMDRWDEIIGTENGLN
jgi:hypothetical protein